MDARVNQETAGVGSEAASSLRWGNGTRSESSAAKDMIVKAALRCYKRLGVRKTSIGDIAAECKVTRPTIYRYFSTHETISATCMRMELDRLYGEVDAELADEDDFVEYLARFLVNALKRLRTDEFWLLTAKDAKPRLCDQLLGDRDILYSHAETLRKRLSRDQRVSADLDCLSVGDWRNRLLESFACLPSPYFRTDDQLLDLFRVMVHPICHPPAGFGVSPTGREVGRGG